MVLLQVVTISSAVAAIAPGVEPVPPPPELMLEQVQREEAESRSYLEQLAQPLREKGLNMECVTVQGTPGQSIVGYADESGVGLIAIATHSRSGLGRLVFGSIADFVLRESGLPILAMKPRETEA